MPTLTSTYQNNTWEQNEYDAPTNGPKLSRVDVKRTFNGEMQGTGEAVLLMCQSTEGNAGYIANEKVICKIAGKSGSFVLQHGATMGSEAHEPFGYIVPGSGTGDFKGMSGSCVWKHDDTQSSFELTYQLA